MSSIDDKIDKKIIPIEELALIAARLKAEGRTIIHCHGVYDLFTPAHTYQFTQAKRKGDIVIVTITEDKHVNKGPGRPFFNEVLRARQVASQMAVDYVAISRWPSGVECINLIKPNFFVKGESNRNYKEAGNRSVEAEVAAVKENNGEMFFTQELPYHSSEALNKFLPVFPPETQAWLRSFRESYTAEFLIQRLEELKKLKCLLIGESIIDQYTHVKALGKPTKGNHIAVDILETEIHAGGILAAANHLAGFCERVDVLTCFGSDDKDRILRNMLKKNVNARFFNREGKTIAKTRFIERFSFNKLFQTYEGTIAPLSPRHEEALMTILEEYFVEGMYDMVLVIDYGHGFLSNECARFISENAPWLGLSVQANTANFGHNVITKYFKADYVCLDEPELRLALHSQWEDPDILASRLLNSVSNNYGKVILTRGHHGCIIPAKDLANRHIPAFSTKVVDAVGAGDAFIALSAPCIKIGIPIEVAGLIGNAIGALAVGVVGNRSAIEPISLFNFINTLLK